VGSCVVLVAASRVVAVVTAAAEGLAVLVRAAVRVAGTRA
jgi:hypothetical protein